MILRLIPLALAMTLVLLAGCQETASETTLDVADAKLTAANNNEAARQGASQDMSDSEGAIARARDDYSAAESAAHGDLSAVEAESMVAAAHSRHDVMSTAARGRFDVAMQRCDGLERGPGRDACVTEAEGVLAVEETEAQHERDEALLLASRHR